MAPTTHRLRPQGSIVQLDPKTGQLMEVRFELKALEPGHPVRILPLTGRMTVGTQQGVDLRLEDQAVSRYHLELTVRPNGVYVRDLDSTNGTLLDGVAVKEAVVLNQAKLRVGNTDLQIRVSRQESNVAAVDSFGQITTRNEGMRTLLGLAKQVSDSSSTVLLLGETGTGKDRLARAIHEASSRHTGPFVVVDCAALAESLVESELFGHRAGAFTGAQTHRAGAFAEAHGGTLFLDEIGELPLSLQPKLLRALDTLTIRPVGDDKVRTVDVRIVAATHRDLAAWSKDGTFRSDLYFRLAVVQLVVPPLRQRLEDLDLLVGQILTERGQPDASLPNEFLTKLRHHSWPGNVRELRNAIDCVLAGSTWEPLSESVSAPASAASEADLPFKEAKDRLLSSFTRRYMEAMVQRCGGNVASIAAAAGISAFYVRQLMKKYNLKSSS